MDTKEVILTNTELRALEREHFGSPFPSSDFFALLRGAKVTKGKYNRKTNNLFNYITNKLYKDGVNKTRQDLVEFGFQGKDLGPRGIFVKITVFDFFPIRSVESELKRYNKFFTEYKVLIDFVEKFAFSKRNDKLITNLYIRLPKDKKELEVIWNYIKLMDRNWREHV